MLLGALPLLGTNKFYCKGEKTMNLECSSKGDKRFCSFYAFVDFDGKYHSIEHHFQGCKRNENDQPCQKGEWASYLIICGQKLPTSDLTPFFGYLWYIYLRENPSLVDYAGQFNTYSNIFRGNSKNCQTDCIKAYVNRNQVFFAPIIPFCKKLNIEI
jgi:hypothetical protein